MEFVDPGVNMNQAPIYIDEYITHIPVHTLVHAHDYGFPKQAFPSPPFGSHFEEI